LQKLNLMKHQILKIFLIFIIVILSCKNESKKTTQKINYNTDTIIENIDQGIVKIPFETKFTPLSKIYKNKKTKEIQDFYYSQIENPTFNGSFMVAKNGEILFEKYAGFKNYDDLSQIGPSTAIHVASVTKIFTAMAILKLVQDHRLELDSKVNTLINNFPYPETTVRTLLNHRSGIPNYLRYNLKNKNFSPTNPLTNQDVINLMVSEKMPRLFAHDTKFAYNNSNYVVLASILEKVTGMKYPHAMKNVLFDPLGLKNTFVLEYKKHKNQVCQSYKANKKLYDWDMYDETYGDKNIYSTPRDLLRLYIATFSPFISKKLWDEAFSGYSYEKKGIKNYGLGFRFMEWENGEKLIYHNGKWHGNTSSFINIRKDSAVIISISNVYTRKTYNTLRMSALFGNYPFQIKPKDTINAAKDSLFLD
jgi:CubicO group peptidase (beta-lactamase class C family)